MNNPSRAQQEGAEPGSQEEMNTQQPDSMPETPLQAEPEPVSRESVPVENVAEPSATGRFTESARGQAGVAAEAFRRGEVIQDVSVDSTASNDDRLIALLCYVSQIIVPLILPILVLISESSKKRPFQRFHAVQSLALTSVFVIGALLVSVGLVIIQIIPLIGQLIGFLAIFCLAPIAGLMALIALVYYGVQAYQGKRFSVPGLTSFLQDQGWI
jgi:uncharacterized membrane protein